jgi:hypothetical protein
MNWTPYTLECAVSAAPIDPATKRPTLCGVDNRGQSVTVWLQPFNAGFDVLRRGVIHRLGERDAVAYLNAFGFVPGGAEVPK